MNQVLALAPAKVNPILQVLGLRDDGYHELCTGLLAIDLCDRVRVSWGGADRGGVSLTVSGPQAGPDIPTDGDNLVHRAACAALQRARALGLVPERGLSLELEKHIPSQAGLGGGSSDAAAALAAVEVLLELDLGAQWRLDCLAGLGSDCPFFEVAREHGAALCRGRGQVVEPLDAPLDWRLALLVPQVRCSTADVYGRLRFPLSRTTPAHNFRELLEMCALEARTGLVNHLQDAAFEAQPALNGWRTAFNAAGLDHFLLSGSGSCFFALYDSEAQAQADLEELYRQAQARSLGVRLLHVAGVARHGARVLPACS